MSSGRYRPLTQEHRDKISSANTGKTMGPQTDEHRRYGVANVVALQACTWSVVCCSRYVQLPVPRFGRSLLRTQLHLLGCSKLRESMQKQWQGKKGAERLEKFRAQVGRCSTNVQRVLWHDSNCLATLRYIASLLTWIWEFT